jgi:cullin-associated NEDD8-dissociated protein 1
VLIKSPLLQGTALTFALNLFQALVQANLPGLTYRHLLAMLLQISELQQNQLLKQAYHSLAKCIAELTVTRFSFY